ncbi:MAG TPA: DUF2723 domain-containing protein [Thermoanaerobaculia bacterium]|jgi:hypothetical protein
MLRLIIAAAVTLAAFVIYVVTLTPTVGLVDSGALTVAAWSLGNAHPPGFPLYLMLTHLATLLPIGTVAFRTNLASAFFAALACGMVSLAAWEMLSYVKPPAKKKAAPEPGLPPAIVAIASAFAGLLLAFSRTLWAYATVTEVYALNTLLVATILWLMLSWRRTNDTKRLYFAALVFGLALGVHHVTVGLTLIGIAVLVLRTAGMPFFRSKSFGIAAAIAIVALIAVYAYLPLAASHEPALNWGDPDDFSGVMKHISAEQYRSYLTTSEDSSQGRDLMRLVTRELGPRWLPVALLAAIFGLFTALRHDRTIFWLLLLVILAGFGWMLIYPIVNDEDAYLLPAIVALVLAAAYGVSRARKPVAMAMLILPVLALIVHWPNRDRSRFFVAKDYVDNALKTVAPNSLLITGDWQLYSPLFYFLEVEKLRPDVKAIQYGMLIRQWYIDQLELRYPDLFAGVRNELAVYRPLLAAYEAGGPQWSDVKANEMQQRLDDLVAALIKAQTSTGGHAFATFDVAMSREAVDQALVRRLAAEYELVPRGVVVEYAQGKGVREVQPVELQLRGLIDGSVRYEPDDVVVTEVLPSYRTVFLLRGRYYGLAQNWAEAEKAYEQALAFDPENMTIKRELAAMRQAAATTR